MWLKRKSLKETERGSRGLHLGPPLVEIVGIAWGSEGKDARYLSKTEASN